MQSGGIDGGHISQSQNDNGRESRQVRCLFSKLVGCAEQEWPMNSQDGYKRGHVLILKDVRLAVPGCIVASRGGNSISCANAEF